MGVAEGLAVGAGVEVVVIESVAPTVLVEVSMVLSAVVKVEMTELSDEVLLLLSNDESDDDDEVVTDLVIVLVVNVVDL